MARQRLGQHFLTRRSILERLAEAACPSTEPLVVEIGAGRGALTALLSARAARVVAIEIDPALARAIRGRHPNVEAVEADVLDTNLGQWGPAVIAGNLPYYITSPILDRIFAAGDAWKRAVLLVQLEVAERLNASHGTRNYGFLTVKTRLFASIKQLFRVPADAFSPPPKVESAAVSLTPIPPPVSDRNGFLEFAARCFRQKRKTLRNNLEPFYGPRVAAWPEARLRAEQIPFEGFLEMYGRLRAESP